MSYAEKYKVSVPLGMRGNWRIDQFTIDAREAGMERLRSMFSAGSRGRGVPEGTYTRLLRGGNVVMSDTPDEIRDHLDPIIQAKGKCLINGLGLGVVLGGVLRKEEVEHVTVVERDEDVIALVAPTYREKFGERVNVVLADAFQYQPPKGVRFGMVWHDIWDNICADNLPEMHRLHRKYGRRADWQGSWCRWLCEDYRRRNY